MLENPTPLKALPSPFWTMSGSGVGDGKHHHSDVDWQALGNASSSDISYHFDPFYPDTEMPVSTDSLQVNTPALMWPNLTPTTSGAESGSSSGYPLLDASTPSRQRSHSTATHDPAFDDLSSLVRNPLGISPGFNTGNFPSQPETSLASRTRPTSPYEHLPQYHSSGHQHRPSLQRTVSAPRTLAPIAPYPVGIDAIAGPKRPFEDEPTEMDPKRRRSSPAVPAYADLSEEDQLLLRLKDGASLPWKEIALCFQSEMGKTFQVPALQMRYKRLRERMRPWSEVDVEALRRAHDYWDRFKWDIIAVKMLDHGCSDKWPSKACQRKWEELHPDLEREGSRACSIRGSGDSDRGTPYPTTPRASFSSPAVHLST